MKQFHPIDPSVPIGALAASPSGGRLALRVGPPGVLSTPALFEPQPGLCHARNRAVAAAQGELLLTIVFEEYHRLYWEMLHA